MISISLRDKKVAENLKVINELKQLGFSNEEIQEIYDKQLKENEVTSIDLSCLVK